MYIQFLLIFNWLQYKPITLGTYVYPGWANAIGWCMALAPVIAVPVTMGYKLCTTKADLPFSKVGIPKT